MKIAGLSNSNDTPGLEAAVTAVNVNLTTIPADLGAIANAMGVSPKFLWYLSKAKNGMYTSIRIPKKGGKYRQVWNPSRPLKFAQKRLTKRVLHRIPKPDHVGAYVSGRSCRHTADQHTGSKLIISMDLESFFDTTTYFMVSSALRTLGMSHTASRVVADICTKDGTVPQGAPTSGDVCNLAAMQSLDPRIRSFLDTLPGKRQVFPKDGVWQSNYDYDWSKVMVTSRGDVEWVEYVFPKDLKLTYTRYSDDLDISSSHAIPRVVVDWMLQKLYNIVRGCRFRVNHNKTKVERSGGRQIVLGMVVNAHANVPRTKYLKYRALVHNCLKTGFDAQAGRAGFDSGLQLHQHLVGMVNYMGQVNPAKRDKLLPVLNEAKELHAAQLE